MENKKQQENSIQNPYYYDDEIDLYELWLVLKKRWKIIAITFFIFLITAGIFAFTATPVYKIEFIVKLPKASSDKNNFLVSSEETKIYLNQINNFLKEKKYNIIAKKLDIPLSMVNHIKNISAQPDRKNKSIISINIEYINKNKEFEQAVVPAIINYLNNNPYLEEKLNLERRKLLSFLKETQNKLRELKKIKHIFLDKVKNKNSKVIGFNPASIDSLIYNLETSVKKYNFKLEELKGYELAIPPYIPDKPYKPKKALILAVAGVSGLFLGIFLAFFLEWLENVRKRHENLNTGEIK